MSISPLQKCKINATLIPKGHLSAIIKPTLNLTGKLSRPSVIGGIEYEGSYEVTPKVDSQNLPTKNKVLVDDMTVKAIPFFNVSNISGGSTVFIGSEV